MVRNRASIGRASSPPRTLGEGSLLGWLPKGTELAAGQHRTLEEMDSWAHEP